MINSGFLLPHSLEALPTLTSDYSLILTSNLTPLSSNMGTVKPDLYSSLCLLSAFSVDYA